MTDLTLPAAPPERRAAVPFRLTCARLREWVLAAKRGATIEYSRGAACSLGCSEELRKYVATLGEMGLLTPHFQREPVTREGIYIVRRTARPVAPGARL